MASRNPRGFTLIELVIVLAILAAVTSLAWPNLRRMSAKGQIQESGRQLRLALAQARLSAIEAGEMRLFQYQPETGMYRVIAPPPPEEDDATATAAVPAEDAFALDAETDDESAPVEQLPPGIVFLPPDAGDEPPTLDDGASTVDSETLLETGGADDAAAWAAPVVFFPNGRSTNVRFRLADGRRYYQDVYLRGLTGTVRLGAVERYAMPLDDSQELPIP